MPATTNNPHSIKDRTTPLIESTRNRTLKIRLVVPVPLQRQVIIRNKTVDI
jgi:hypothetical protein